MIGIVGCCARTASGHAAAPPINKMKSRRLMCPSGRAKLPHHQDADTALCSTAKLTADRPLGVKSVGSTRWTSSRHVRCASDSDRIDALQRTDAKCHFRT
jgi:hypothetical protein